MAAWNRARERIHLTAVETKDIEHSNLIAAICFSSSEFFEESDMFRSKSLVSLRRLHEINEMVLLQHDFIAFGLKKLLLRFLEVKSE